MSRRAGAVRGVWTALLVGLLGTRAGADALYTFTDLGTLPGDSSSSASAINNAGQVVGTSSTAATGPGQPTTMHPFLYSGGQIGSIGNLVGTANAINDSGQVVGEGNVGGSGNHAFLDDNGTITRLDTSSPTIGTPHGINNAGQVVGDLNGNPPVFVGQTQAYLLSGGQAQTIQPPGSQGTSATAINALGQIVGLANTNNSDWGLGHAFLQSGGTFHDLGTLGGLYSQASGINAPGDVVGSASTTSGASHAFLYSGGTMHDLGTLGGANSGALGINALGQIVGSSDFALGSSTRHAFLYNNGSMIDLNSVISSQIGWTLVSATGINDLGQIVGSAVDASGAQHAFLLTPQGVSTPTLGDPAPVPEPSTLAFFGVAAAAAVLRRRRRRPA